MEATMKALLINDTRLLKGAVFAGVLGWIFLVLAGLSYATHIVR
jgi:hypothetical protein